MPKTTKAPKTFPRTKSGRVFSREHKNSVVDAYEAGASAKQLAKENDTTVAHICDWVQKRRRLGKDAFPGKGQSLREREAPEERPRKLLPFGAKAHNFAFRDPALDRRITILSGSVRSSKTWSTIVKIVLLCGYPVAGQRLLTGKSKDSVKANVLNDLFDIIGTKNYHFNNQSGELQLFNTRWRVIGGYDQSSEKILRGSTVGVVVTDELTLHPESFVKMLLSRLSPEGARWYATTNPDSPYHYVMTDIIAKNEMKPYVELIKFTLDDNPHISDEYRTFIKNSYFGVWKRRYVDGDWVVASGSIYGDSFDAGNIYRDGDRPSWAVTRGERTIAIDYGTTNPQVYGDIYDDSKNYWMENEYYWDSRERGRQKTDVQYADDLINGFESWPGFPKDPRHWPRVIVDPSAASFRAELVNRGILVQEANNAVLDGIRRTTTLFSRKLFRIHEKCKNVIQDVETYSWDEHACKHGDEKPLKEHDHGPDMIRYKVETDVNDWRLTM